MSYFSYRRERQSDGSIKTTSASYPDSIKVCQTCEWCKAVNSKNNKELESVLICHLQQPPVICGVYKWPAGNRKTYEFVSMIPQAELKDMKPLKSRENNCEDHLPFGWHYDRDLQQLMKDPDKNKPMVLLTNSYDYWALE